MQSSAIPTDILERAARIKLAIFDVDGVLTNGQLVYSEDGHELKSFHVHDGLGLKRLRANGIEVAIITARISHLVSRRMADLGVIHVYQGQEDKRACFDELLHALKLGSEACSYTGDDLPDLGVMAQVGLAVAVANAHPSLLTCSHWQTQREGGAGAVREVCDLLLQAQGKTDAEIALHLGKR
ncbi:MAG TPA: HAD family hydrolase [Dokdonella sp.]|uniref:KdsC family phosphatase n=1 Tax=Dokdonella sp. TaxID=2291710 RepID=UPI002D7FEFAF|nr:HAD family hydrolase [Dokdonella sp.]HET9033343.1 HAD family hydrolase [Dokdonella sp.]